MPFVVKTEGKSETLVFEVPMELLEFVKEAKDERPITSPPHSMKNLLNIPEHDVCSTSLGIKLVGGSVWELTFTLEGPYDSGRDLRYHLDVKSTLTAETRAHSTLTGGSPEEDDEEDSNSGSKLCGKYIGSVSPYDSYQHVMPVTLEQLQTLVEGREWDQLTLCLIADVMVFTTTGTWKAVESIVHPQTHLRLPAAPYIHHLTGRQKTDVSIECQRRVFPAHALVLKCISPVFERMLDADTREGPQRRIAISDMAEDTVEQMLEFIYTGFFSKNLAKLSTEQLVELLHCADKYQIGELKTEVLHLMKASLAVENAIKLFSAVKLYAAGAEGQAVASEMLNFCMRNVAKFPKDSDLKNFLVQNWDALV